MPQVFCALEVELRDGHCCCFAEDPELEEGLVLEADLEVDYQIVFEEDLWDHSEAMVKDVRALEVATVVQCE